ncbi:MAG TPA: hypothetical protein DDZ80_12090 [Cyanobacteria bacterium UBA8803]|nr:hypothetical protein [Cyanobacteria bacterium UBA9273]HBL59219.1 hypothetical protein [Cyanobacteria bacterium UBA8803]
MTCDRCTLHTSQYPSLEPGSNSLQVESSLERHEWHLQKQVWQESAELYRVILSNIPEVVFLTDETGVFKFISPQVERIFGHRVTEVESFGNIAQLLGDNLFNWKDLETFGELCNIKRNVTDKLGQQRTLLINIKHICVNNREQGIEKREQEQNGFHSLIVSAAHGASIGEGVILYSCRDITEYNQALDAGRNSSLQLANQDITEKQQAEEALQQQHEILQTIFDHIPVMVAFYDAKGQIQLINRELERVLGWSLSEAKNCDLLTKCYPEPQERQKVLEFMLAASGKWQDFKTRTRSGQVLDTSWANIRLSNGTSIGIGQDITERQRTEEAIRRQLAAVEAAMDGIATLNSKGEYLYLNEAHVKLFGYSSSAELLGKTWHEFYEPNEIARFEQDVFPILMQKGQWRGEAIAKKRDGSTFFEEVSLTLTDGGGIICVCRDITKRKQAEQQVKEAKERLELVIHASNDGFWDWDFLTEEIYFSPRWKEMIGYEDWELPNYLASWERVIFAEDRLAALKLVEDYNSGKVPRFLATQRFHHKKGSTVHILSRAIHLKDDRGQVIRMIGAHTDITELVKAQEALQALSQQEREKATQLELTLQQLKQTQTQLIQQEKMASLGQLVAGVAHEINNPTCFIYGNIHPAKEYALDLLHLLRLYQQHYPQPLLEISEQLEALDIEFIAQDFSKLLGSIEEGANRICTIVKSLKNFSRLDETELKRVDIHEGIDSTLLILQHRLKQRASHSEIRVIKEYGQLPMIECYSGQLNQVFMNIISNAIDALEMRNGEGGMGNGKEYSMPTIRIRTEMLESCLLNGDRKQVSWVVIRISDNGSGITTDIQPRLFDPFFTTKPPGKGTGLGLSISYRIVVDQHKGQLWCCSSEGQGAEFAIELPIVQPQTYFESPG